jgi:hypothetical protein
VPAEPDAAKALAVAVRAPDAERHGLSGGLTQPVAGRGAVAEQHAVHLDAAAFAERQPGRGQRTEPVSQPLGTG